jgi:uncharacterized protein involved in exopolysaccharide biosynthesis
MADDRHNLQDILPIIQRRKTLLWKLTIATIVLGVLAHFIIPRYYKAESIVVLKNPLYSDRGNLYSSDNKAVEYFATE